MSGRYHPGFLVNYVEGSCVRVPARPLVLEGPGALKCLSLTAPRPRILSFGEALESWTLEAPGDPDYTFIPEILGLKDPSSAALGVCGPWVSEIQRFSRNSTSQVQQEEGTSEAHQLQSKCFSTAAAGPPTSIDATSSCVRLSTLSVPRQLQFVWPGNSHPVLGVTARSTTPRPWNRLGSLGAEGSSCGACCCWPLC